MKVNKFEARMKDKRPSQSYKILAKKVAGEYKIGKNKERKISTPQ